MILGIAQQVSDKNGYKLLQVDASCYKLMQVKFEAVTCCHQLQVANQLLENFGEMKHARYISLLTLTYLVCQMIIQG